MKKIWDKIGVFPVTKQRLADQARQIQTNKRLTDIAIEETRRKLVRKNTKMEVQENDQEIIEHNENKQSHSEEQVVQKILVEKGHENIPHLFISRR